VAVISKWGCKCIVLTTSKGATAYIDSTFISPENRNQVIGLEILIESGNEQEKVIIEYSQKAATVEVLINILI
jgi:hypothetical protein